MHICICTHTHIPTSPCCGFKQDVLSFSGSKLWPNVSMLRSHQIITWKWKFRIKSHWVEMGCYKKDDQISIRIKSHWPLIYWNTGYSENGSRSRRPKLYFCMTFDAFGYCQKMAQSSVAMCLFADPFFHFWGIMIFTTCSIHDAYFDRAYFITWQLQLLPFRTSFCHNASGGLQAGLGRHFGWRV